MSLKRITLLLVVVGALALIATGQVGATTTLDTHSEHGESGELIHEQSLASMADSHVKDCAATPPSNLADPEGTTSEVVGWVDGYWYNETVDVRSLSNKTQIEALTKRTAAQVEALRCLTFKTVPPVEFVEEYGSGASIDSEQRRFQNALSATLFFAGHDEDVTDSSEEGDVSPGRPWYEPVDDSINFPVGEDGTRWMSGPLLVHELTHALQDQRLYNLSAPKYGLTLDQTRAILGVSEGGAGLVETLYRRNCRSDAWNISCFRRSSPDGSLSESTNTGSYLIVQSSYNMPLVEETYEEAGWSGVNALSEDLPESTAETIDPDKYGALEPVSPEVPDRSGDRWNRVEPGPGKSYEVVGQVGLTAMFTANQVHDTATFFDSDGYDTISRDYGIPSTNGWTGDRFHAYANEDGDIAAVWRIEWASESDATQFVETYEATIEANDGTQAGNADTVYTFEDSDEYDMAVAIEQEGTSILIVTAPSVDELTAVHGSLDLPANSRPSDTTPANNDTQPTETEEQESSGAETPADADETDREPSADDDGAGFGAIVATLAVVLTALVGHIPRRW